MRRFSSFLRELYKRLDLPQPTKSRIILEVAADLDDLYNAYRNKGLTEDEAMEKAIEKLDFNEDSLNQLVQVHTSFLKKWIDKISIQAQTRWEKIIMILVIMLLASMSIKVIATTQFFIQAGKFVWPIIGIGIITGVLALKKYYQLYIKKDHNIKNLHSGLPFMLFLAGASICIGYCGFFIEIFIAGKGAILPGSSLVTLVCTVVQSQTLLLKITNCFLKSSSVVMVSTFVATLTTMIWFAFINKVVKIERSETESFLKAE